MTSAPRFVIVGAGPAGVRAAEQLVRAGHRPVVIDEAPRCGGQIYRQPPDGRRRPARELYGYAAAKAEAVHRAFESLRPSLDHRADTLAWHLEPGVLHLLSGGVPSVQPFDALILATGATDRVLPFAGWTLPGVVTLGAAQVALKAQAVLLGPRIVFAGSGPLLPLVAWQYASHGADVAAVLDAAPPGTRRRAAARLLSRPGLALQGALLLARLRARGVPYLRGARLVRAHGHGRVEAVEFEAAGRARRIDCDALAVCHGLRSESQLADLAGCAFDFDDTDQAWRPRCTPAGRSSVRGVYLAGDGAGILGADAAEASGARAGLSALEDFGSTVPGGDAQRLEAELQVHRRFRAAVETLSPPPADWAAHTADDVVVCRCEEITAGDLRRCVRDTGTGELNRLKALTRVGMGRCQGRMCGAAAARVLAHATGRSLADVGRLRGQPPVKPVPIHAIGAAAPAATAVPQDQRDD